MLILASQSASRTAMLAAAGVPFTAEPAHELGAGPGHPPNGTVVVPHDHPATGLGDSADIDTMTTRSEDR